MQNTKVLEMLISDRIEELKQLLRDEIYADILKSKPGAKKRYAAMKKYFSYVDSEREYLKKPCLIEYNGENYTSFCNSFSVALTKEPCGVIALYEDVDRYPDVGRLITKEGDVSKIDFAKVLAKAKVEGYKLVKNEFNSYKCKFFMRYRNAHFKLVLLDATFAIIDDGEPATVYIRDGERSPITIETSIGICTIMPMTVGEGDYTVIEAEEVSE